MKGLFLFVITLTLVSSLFITSTRGNISATDTNLDALVESDIQWLLSTYKMLHAAPELSHREEKTSAFFAAELRKYGYEVTERIGKYENAQWSGFGVVGIMKSGAGPTVLIRTDLDALPVEEKTGVAYASKVRKKHDAGVEVGVMHACGHDIH